MKRQTSRAPSPISIATASVVSTLEAGTTAVIMAEAAAAGAVADRAADAAVVAVRVADAADRGGNCFGSRGNQELEREGGCSPFLVSDREVFSRGVAQPEATTALFCR